MRKYRERIKTANALAENTNNVAPVEQSMDNSIPIPELESDLTNTISLAEARKSWPRRLGPKNVPSPIRLSILKSALKAIIKLVKPRGCKPKVSGLYYDWHYRVYLFLKLQVQQEQKVLQGTDLFTGKVHALENRKVLAKKVADGGGWGSRIQERIMRQEVSWVKRRYIEKPKQGQHQKILFMLEDAETMLTVRNYISSVGDSK